MTATTRKLCRLCESINLELALKLASTPIGDAYVSDAYKAQECYPVELFLCRDCGLSQLLYVLNPESVYGGYIYRTSDSLGLVEHFRKYADSIIKTINPKAGSLAIDVGSNDGSLLRFFKKNGMKVLGIDPAGEIAHEATESGVETIADFFTQKLAIKIKKIHGNASIITINNAFANIDDIKDLANGIRELLAPDGVLVFETGYFPDLLAKCIFDNIYHEHLSYFSVKPLKKFFESRGMEIIDAIRIPTKGGSIRCIVQFKNGPGKVADSVEHLVKIEDAQGIHRAETIKAFGAKLEKIKRDLLKILHELKSKGNKIAGYGASVGVTTVIYNFGLDNKILDFIVDDNPSRQSLYSPGLHIPVFSPEELYRKKTGYAVILAWQYAEPIIKKHKAYLAQGGKFITFLPEIRVIEKLKP